MAVHVQIAPGLDGQVQQAVAGQRLQHVVEETDPGLYPRFALPIQVYPDVKVGLLSGAGDLSDPGHAGLRTASL